MAGSGGAGSLFAVFPVIPGAVMGEVRTPAIMVIQASADGHISLPLSELGRRIQPLAKTLRAEFVQAGLSVQPESLRIARVGTFIYDGDSELTEGAGIQDPRNKDSLVLIYADRPGAITGTLSSDESGQTSYIFDLKIPAAGLHWIRFHPLDSTHTKMIVDDAPGSPILGTGSQLRSAS